MTADRLFCIYMSIGTLAMCLAGPVWTEELPSPIRETQILGSASPPASFTQPYALAVDRASNVYVAHDGANPRVLKFSRDGTFLHSFPFETYGIYNLGVSALAATADSTLWIMDAGGVLQRWRNESEAMTWLDNSKEEGTLPFAAPFAGLAASPNYLFMGVSEVFDTTEAYGADVGIAALNDTGGVVHKFRTKCHTNECPGPIEAIAADVNDNVYVIAVYTLSNTCASNATRFRELRKYSKTGDTLKTWPLPSPSQVPQYTGLAVDRAGAIYLTSTEDAIDVIAADATETTFHYTGAETDTALDDPRALAMATDCRLYVSDDYDRVIGVSLDADRDGICDSWERDGILVAGEPDTLHLLNANVQKPDIYVEIDCMAGFEFDTTLARGVVVQAFEAHSIALHAEVDTVGLPHAIWGAGIADYDSFRASYFGKTSDSPARKKAKSLVYRYCAFADSALVDSVWVLGLSDENNDIMITLGARKPASGGVTPWESQAGVFMHELGHTLGLNHGGAAHDTTKYKPNYFSVMNYSWTEPASYTKGVWTVGYSDSELAGVTEVALVDGIAIGAPPDRKKVPIRKIATVKHGVTREEFETVKASSPDWDHDPSTPTCYNCDVNTMVVGKTGRTNESFVGHKDWGNLQFAWRHDELQYVLWNPNAARNEQSVDEALSNSAAICDCNGNDVNDMDDIANGTSLDVEHDWIPDECEPSRITGLADTVVMCPGGDADSLLWVVDVEETCVPGSCGPDYARIDSLGPGVVLWREDGTSIAVDDTMAAYLSDYSDDDRRLVHFRVARASGCGVVRFSVFDGDSIVLRGVGTYVRSLDVSGEVLGAVDRLDASSWLASATCDTCYPCGDFDRSGLTQSGGDLALLTDHLGHHISRRVLSPDGGQVFSPGDTTTICWAPGVGDSSRVTLLLLTDSTPDTTTIVSDHADGGTFAWTVPVVRATDDYRIMVRHSAGTYSVDYVSTGSDESDTTFVILPVAVSDLAVGAGRTTAVASWTEPGQVGVEADEYDIRRSTSALTETNFGGASSVTPDNDPGPQYTDHCIGQGSLNSCQWYYYGIKTRIGSLWSRISNVGSAKTKCSGSLLVSCNPGDLMAGGEGGEEEFRAGRTQMPRLASQRVAQLEVGGEANENSLLPGARTGQEADLFKISGAGAVDGSYRVRLRQTEGGSVHLKRLGLAVVDRDSAAESYVASGSVLVGRSSDLGGVWTREGSHPTDSDGFAARGDLLSVDLGADTARTALLISARAPLAEAFRDTAGIVVQALAPDSVWQVVGKIQPRRYSDEFAVDVTGHSIVRLLFQSSFFVGPVRRLAIDQLVHPTEVQLVSAEHSRLGSVLSAVATIDSAAIELDPSDDLALSAPAGQAPSGSTRDVFLVVAGSYDQVLNEARSAPLEAALRPAVWRNGLGLARPNPSARHFTIEYTLAKESLVTIRVYDVAGRITKTLVDSALPAGQHEAVWDGRDASGGRAAAGVFFYRMVTSGWKSEPRALVLVR